MKFTLPLLAIVAGLASASPIRIMMVTTSYSNQAAPPSMPVHIRIGHAGQGITAEQMQAATAHAYIGHPGGRPPCHGKVEAMRAKALEISNSFRHALGMPLIEVHPHGVHQGLTMVPVAPFESVHRMGLVGIPEPEMVRHHGHAHGFHRESSFWGRIHRSLMSLGPWEGRAVAFVLGCGLGVLIRMLFVLAIISYRAITTKNGAEQEREEIAYIVLADGDVLFDEVTDAVPPPQYTHQKDGQVLIGAEKN